MESNIYRPPTAELRRDADTAAEFYLVSKTKFLLLYMATLGLYGVYWFYRHWRSYRSFHRLDIWPVPRALFSVVFAYSLFRRIFARAGQHPRPGLMAALYAGVYVLFEIGGNSAELLSSRGFGEIDVALVSFACMCIVAIILLRAQIFANRACGDPAATANRRFSALNLLWIAAGLLFWLISVFGLLLIAGVIQPWEL